MYLKSLKVVGFKSFADRTRLELRPGVTVVVGPNGSGKSNLVDAVSWVMGTQSTKSLRTQKMEDVVFAGTATRPALNRAEVTLVFDNESRTLPIDIDEVSLTRRLYRDGSSDYEMNGVPCRLLDIQELLSDSGVGRHQHVIVGQGQIETVLNSGPTDHRAVIEEAAGVLKHRGRKDRALRRLERTDADVLRLQDIAGEITRQMRPLKRQANAAEQAAELETRIQELRLYLGGQRLRRLDERSAAISAEHDRLTGWINDGEAEVGELASALHILTAEAGHVGEALDRDTAAAARLETTLERIRRSSSVAHERYRAAQARREGADERRRDLDEELTLLDRQVVEVGAEVAEAEAAAHRREQRFRSLEDEARSLFDQGNLSPEGALAVLRGEVRSIEGAEGRDSRELEQIDRRMAVVEAQLRDDEEETGRVKDEIHRLDEQATVGQAAYERALAERRSRQERWEAMEDALGEARLASASSRARLDAVSAAGSVDPRARETLAATSGHRGTLTSLMDIPSRWVAAVDAALGPWAGSAVFDDHESLERAVGLLKSGGFGGLGAVTASGERATTARDAAAELGVDALVDLVGAAHDAELMESLIGDVLAVEGWSMALRIAARHPHLRVVTPEGDLVTVSGVRVGQPDGAGPTMVDAAGRALEEAETELARVTSLHTSARRDFEHSRQRERGALEELEAVEARLSGASEALGRLTRGRANLEDELQRLAERRRSLREISDDRRVTLHRLRARLTALEGEEAERQRAWDEMEERRAALEAEREGAREAWQQATAELRAARERLQITERRRRDVATSLEGDMAAPVSDAELERLALIEELGRRAGDVLSRRLGELRDRQAEWRRRAAATGSQRDGVRTRHDASRARLEQARKRLGELEVEATEIRVRREGVAEALRRDADSDEHTALAAPAPDVEDDDDLEAVLDDMTARFRRMGPVNPLAAHEYAELAERHTFLTDQLADLETSRQELRRVVSALDEEIQTRFLAAFEEVAAAYEQHFSVLFPGGAGRLRLSDPSDPLETGVEIQAQPLGKKVSDLSLLSGGERSLAALAFLFAVFKARPSPFYLLDEVEAALDDANLRRFLRLMDAFRADAQLVIVTHQQQTMEAADVLYGVTMEPGGSSQVVRKEVVAVEDTIQRTGRGAVSA